MLSLECRRSLRGQPPDVRAAYGAVIDAVRRERICSETERFLSGLAANGDLKLNLGCGDDLKAGFVNIDYRSDARPPYNKIIDDDTVFVQYDLGTRGLPFDETTCSLIYSSHFFEHLDYVQGRRLMDDCFRALQDGGRFRVVLPNIRRAMEAYLNSDVAYFDGITDPELTGLINWMPYLRKDDLSFVDIVNLCVYQRGEHKCIYDEDKMIKILRNIGFSGVTVADFEANLDCSDDLRKKYSFYVEAVK